MQTQINKILSQSFSGYSANYTYATDIPIRIYPTSQKYAIDQIKEICDYTDHVFYLVGTTFYFVDILTGSTSYTATDFVILENGLNSSTPDSIISKFEATWSTRQFNDQVYQLDSVAQREEISTGLSTGTTQSITPLSYINSEVLAVLTRKKTLYLKDVISIKLGTVQHIQIGTVVTLSSDYATGSFVVTEKTLTKEGDEILSGYGSITY